MANPSVDLEQPAPRWNWGQIAIRAAIVAYLIVVIAHFMPATLRPAWFSEAVQKALLNGFTAIYFLMGVLFGFLSDLRPGEKAAIGLVFGLAALGSVLTVLDVTGAYAAPPRLVGALYLVLIAVVVGFIYVRFVRRHLSTQRRVDPSMDAD